MQKLSSETFRIYTVQQTENKQIMKISRSVSKKAQALEHLLKFFIQVGLSPYFSS